MPSSDPDFDRKARAAILAGFDRRMAGRGRRRVYLVSYPRSGNTLVREYCALLQGRPQPSLYRGDVIGTTAPPLTSAWDRVDIVKSHHLPADDAPMIYLVRDGRNATLSFIYMTFLFSGHRFARLDELCDAIDHHHRTEGSWADHLAATMAQRDRRPVLILRYEELVQAPDAALAQIAGFLGAELPAAAIAACVQRQRTDSAYTANPYNGYLHEPEPGSIYDRLQRHRKADYWRHIFDARSKRHFHEGGGTPWLLQFGYEQSADWWME